MQRVLIFSSIQMNFNLHYQVGDNGNFILTTMKGAYQASIISNYCRVICIKISKKGMCITSIHASNNLSLQKKSMKNPEVFIKLMQEWEWIKTCDFILSEGIDDMPLPNCYESALRDIRYSCYEYAKIRSKSEFVLNVHNKLSTALRKVIMFQIISMNIKQMISTEDILFQFIMITHNIVKVNLYLVQRI